MGKTTIYLLPVDAEIAPAEYALRAQRVLTDMGVVDGVPDEDDPTFFGAGPRSLEPFEGEIDEEIGFELCIIYGDERVEIVPQDPAVWPWCPACSTDVSDLYYELMNDVEELDPKLGYLTVTLECPGCKGSFRLDELRADDEIVLTRMYINFDDVLGALNETWLSRFDEAMGVRHRWVEYYYT